MRLTALELPACFGRPAEQLARAHELLSGSGSTDVVLLPEASLTGYVSARGDFDLAPFAEPADGPTARALAELARVHHTNVFGPLIERAGVDVYNTCIGFDRAGREIARYRKRHPWYPETWAAPGRDPHPLIEIDGVRVTIAICFDVHFLEDGLPAAEVLLFPSAWVETTEPRATDSRATLLPEVARSFALTIVNANWGPGEPCIFGQGGSCIVRASGVTSVVRSGACRVDAELLV